MSLVRPSGRLYKQLTEQEQIEADKLFLKYPSASRSVWSYPMLQALASGVKGGKWFSLKDKNHDSKTLLIAFNAVAKNKGSCGIEIQTIEMFESKSYLTEEWVGRQIDDSFIKDIPKGVEPCGENGAYRTFY